MNYYRKKHNNYKKELSKRRNKKWKKFKEKQSSEGKKLKGQGELTKNLSDNSLTSIIERERGIFNIKTNRME